jgi:Icc-related predicted phosphoesterase
MRLVLTSDLHGQLPAIPPCDVLLIAGDLCPIHDHDIVFQYQWLNDNFVPWLAQTPARHRLFIAGNHDFVFALEPAWVQRIPFPGVYLRDSGATVEGVTFWGSPWANELPGWPFTAPDEELRLYWSLIPAATQVLMVHGPPRGYGDQIIGNRSGDVLQVGSPSLLERIEVLPNLQLVVFGHIHEGAGIYHHRDLPLVNAAYMDVNYKPTQPIQVWELADSALRPK